MEGFNPIATKQMKGCLTPKTESKKKKREKKKRRCNQFVLPTGSEADSISCQPTYMRYSIRILCTTRLYIVYIKKDSL